MKIFENSYFCDFIKMMKFKKKKSSSLFQFFERTIASTETNDTSAESPGSQLFFWHPESGRGSIRRAPRPLAAKSIGARGVKKVILGQEGVAAS